MSPLTSSTKIQIRDMLNDIITGALEKVEQEPTYRPFHEAVFSQSLLSASTFERSFSTRLGQTLFEKMALLLATAAGSPAQLARRTSGEIDANKLKTIEGICSDLRRTASGRKPDWAQEVAAVHAASGGGRQVVEVISDLWVGGEQDRLYSMKTVKPNLDQTGQAKRDMLTLKALDDSCEVYFALCYNPYGESKADYAWTFPFKIFKMRTDPCVLIGRDFWENLAWKGVYEELLSVFCEAGESIRERLGVQFGNQEAPAESE